MRKTFLISALTAIVVMAIAVLALPRLGTAVAEPVSPEAVTANNMAYIAMVVEKAKKTAAFAAAHPRLFRASNASVTSVASVPPMASPQRAESSSDPSACCSSWNGFNIQGLVMTPDRAGTPCSNCVVDELGQPADKNNVGFAFPWGEAWIGYLFETDYTMHIMNKPGTCIGHYGWWSIPVNNWIAFGSTDTFPCGDSPQWLFEFPGPVSGVPGPAGEAIAVAIVQHSDGTTVVDYEQFTIIPGP